MHGNQKKNDVKRIFASLDLTEAELDNLVLDLKVNYFLLSELNDEISAYDDRISKRWSELMKGKTDEYSYLTFFFCIGSGIKPKTTISEREARLAIRKIHAKMAWIVIQYFKFIEGSAPPIIKEDLMSLWSDEIQEIDRYILDDSDKMESAIRLLKEKFDIKFAEK